MVNPVHYPVEGGELSLGDFVRFGEDGQDGAHFPQESCAPSPAPVVAAGFSSMEIFSSQGLVIPFFSLLKIARIISRSKDRFVDNVIGWLIDWLIDWLIWLIWWYILLIRTFDRDVSSNSWFVSWFFSALRVRVIWGSPFVSPTASERTGHLWRRKCWCVWSRPRYSTRSWSLARKLHRTVVFWKCERSLKLRDRIISRSLCARLTHCPTQVGFFSNFFFSLRPYLSQKFWIWILNFYLNLNLWILIF